MVINDEQRLRVSSGTLCVEGRVSELGLRHTTQTHNLQKGLSSLLDSIQAGWEICKNLYIVYSLIELSLETDHVSYYCACKLHWITPGSPLAHHWITTLDHPWITTGITPWITPGSPLDHPWITPGSPLDHPWITPWLTTGSPLDHPWITPGSPLDHPWITPGSPLDHHWITPWITPWLTPGSPLDLGSIPAITNLFFFVYIES